jgi:hypothetical protein
MTRRYVESLAAATGATSVKAVYPDAGVAAMLAHNWQDRTFAIDSLNARRPVSADDDLIVICCPDPFGAEECQRTVRQVSEQDEKAGVMDRPVVLFNQRLSRWVTTPVALRRSGGGIAQRWTWSIAPLACSSSWETSAQPRKKPSHIVLLTSSGGVCVVQW